MVSNVESIIITLALIVFGVANLLRHEWFIVSDANPLSRLFRARKRARFGDRYN